MIEHIWSVICSRMITDKETNNISLMDVIEEITIQVPPPPTPKGQPGFAIPLTLVTLWRREPEDQPTTGRGRISLLTPQQDAPELISDYEIDLLHSLRMRAHGTLPGLPFRGLGIYRFVIQLQNEGETEWNMVASIPLRIVAQETREDALPIVEGDMP